MKLLLLTFLICVYSQIIEYVGEGSTSFTGSVTLDLCANNSELVCNNLNFINATLYLEVTNDFNNVFVIDQDYTTYYVGFYNQTITDDDDIEIDSFGVCNVSYTYVAYYSTVSPANNLPAAINYTGNGTMSFTDVTSLVFCDISNQYICDNLNFVSANVYLEVSNKYNNLFWVNMAWNPYYVKTFNQSYTYNFNTMEIDSPGPSNLTYSYVAFYANISVPPSTDDSTTPVSFSPDALWIALIVLMSVVIVGVISYCIWDNRAKCGECGAKCRDGFRKLK